MSKVLISIDEQGYLLAEASDEYRVLADFLSGDVQGSLSGTQDILNRCDLVSDGKIEDWVATGNAHTISISRNGVKIMNEYSGESAPTISIEDFRSYIEEWKKFTLERKLLLRKP